MPLCHTRIKTFGDFMSLSDFLFINEINQSAELLCPKKITPLQSAYILQTLIWFLEDLQNYSSKDLEKASHMVADVFKINHKKVVIPILFAAIMGRKCGLPLFASVDILGKERTRARFLQALEFVGGVSNKKLAKLKKHVDKQDASSFYNE